jgi:hypothetical protein
MENNIKVRVGESGDAVTVWNNKPAEISAVSKIKTQTGSDCKSPMASKLEALLTSVRARNSVEQTKQSITLPSLLAHSHKVSADDDDSDSESDTESTTSSFFSETSSADSMTSVSSTSSSAVQKSSTLTLDVEKAPVYVPRKRLTATESTPTRYLSRSERRLASATVDKSKADICQYKYQGGQTSVMTGGVMLGSVKPTAVAATKPAAVPTSRTPIATKGRTVKKVFDSSNNWRTRI